MIRSNKFLNGRIIFSDARIIYRIKYRLDDTCIRKDDTDRWTNPFMPYSNIMWRLCISSGFLKAKRTKGQNFFVPTKHLKKANDL